METDLFVQVRFTVSFSHTHTHIHRHLSIELNYNNAIVQIMLLLLCCVYTVGYDCSGINLCKSRVYTVIITSCKIVSRIDA